jgi:tight adherence protein C
MFLLLLASLILIAIAVMLVARGALVSRGRSTETLHKIGTYGFTNPAADEDERGRLTSSLDTLACRLGDIATSWSSRLDVKTLRNLLIAAGYFHVSPRKFTGYRILFTAFGIGMWFWLLAAGNLSSFLTLVTLIALPVMGWMGPLWFVRTRARRRLERIDYDLPELIDLLVVTVEAGVGFSASLQIATGRLEGPLAEELQLVLQEQAMGLATNEALRNMLARCDTPAVRSFVRSILQGEQLGVSIGQIMRNLAGEMRKRRRAAAEERAQKAPIKMLFPLVFLIFPAMFVVLLMPAVLSFLNALHG